MYSRMDDIQNINVYNCSRETFNRSSIVQCSKFIFKTEEINILNEVWPNNFRIIWLSGLFDELVMIFELTYSLTWPAMKIVGNFHLWDRLEI